MLLCVSSLTLASRLTEPGFSRVLFFYQWIKGKTSTSASLCCSKVSSLMSICHCVNSKRTKANEAGAPVSSAAASLPNYLLLGTVFPSPLTSLLLCCALHSAATIAWSPSSDFCKWPVIILSLCCATRCLSEEPPPPFDAMLLPCL